METNPNFREIILDLIAQGYTVEMFNENAGKFNEKYRVCKNGKVVVLNAEGKITGYQG